MSGRQDWPFGAPPARARKKFHGWRREFNFSHREAIVGLVARRAQASRAETFLLMSELRSAANKSRPRGFISDWDIGEGAFACELEEATVTRILDVLYAVGWLEQEAIASWADTQPEDEDSTAAERKRRERGRKTALKDLARRHRAGLITEQERLAEEAKLQSYQQGVSRRDTVTVTTDSDSDKKASGPSEGSADGDPSRMSRRDSVTHSQSGESGDNAIDPELWLEVTGAAILMDRLECRSATVAAVYLNGWRKSLADDAGLVDVLQAVERAGHRGTRFRTEVVNAISRRRAQSRGPQLPLMAPVKRGGHG